MTTANDLIERFEKLFPLARAMEVDGHIVTTGTSEGVFAYGSDGFEWGIKAAEVVEVEKYTEFCAHCEPETDADLARTVYTQTELQICHGGTCCRVIDFDDEPMVSEDEEDWD